MFWELLIWLWALPFMNLVTMSKPIRAWFVLWLVFPIFWVGCVLPVTFWRKYRTRAPGPLDKRPSARKKAVVHPEKDMLQQAASQKPTRNRPSLRRRRQAAQKADADGLVVVYDTSGTWRPKRGKVSEMHLGQAGVGFWIGKELTDQRDLELELQVIEEECMVEEMLLPA
ncbi:hypothetical protein PHLGIDRAFT_128226 [Phlebiopsis gigantea 11061_1 CR5-6]|uniref:Uncharacterized protein n=1 Tax=Phlebiopsis gigantea (strain 11061_1 CR5-6) TaxID=745531 RepID=A0A0C3S707_PHLG1|nr:hypothetical protein PHLGIDRAFT_128226 [Phlebiopsis gigantea 11061_1 CR5-6]